MRDPAESEPLQPVTAERAAVLVDADAYFNALRDVMTRARRSILIVGWDVHSQLQLSPAAEDPADRCELAPFLEQLTRKAPGLRVSILTWDFAPIYLAEREMLPVVQFAWRAGSRVQLCLASDHPLGASHHQKIVVVDEAVAFLGGIDLTIARWDTPEHRPEHPARRLPGGEPYGPFHDAQLCVCGQAAAVLADLVRARFRRATGEPPRHGGRDTTGTPPSALWPTGVRPDFEGIQVQFLRTAGAWESSPAVHEIEASYLSALRNARVSIYIENQYLTAKSIAACLCESLREEAGPEVVIVTPRAQSGRLEQATMGRLRARVVRRLRHADRHGRLRVFAPVVGAQACPVNVHAKLMIVDDRVLRVGSANLSNRSMRLDTECDAVIEGDRATTRERIATLRDRLLGEHLGVSAERIGRELERTGSLIAAVERLREEASGRTLERLEISSGLEGEAVEEELSLLGDAELVDPVGPLDEVLARRALPEEAMRLGSRRLPRVLLSVLVVVALAAAWLWLPLERWTEPRMIAQAASWLSSDGVVGGLIASLLFVGASLAMVPVTALIVATTLVFGTWIGFMTAVLGSLGSAAAGYGIGRVLWRDAVRRLAGKRLNRLSHELARRGTLALAALRVVPVAPFTVVNLVAGASHVRFRDYMLGTGIGMAPGIFALCLASDQLVAAVRNPDAGSIAIGVTVLAGAVAFTVWLRRLAARLARRKGDDG